MFSARDGSSSKIMATPRKNLTPLTRKQLAGVQCEFVSILTNVVVDYFGIFRVVSCPICCPYKAHVASFVPFAL